MGRRKKTKSTRSTTDTKTVPVDDTQANESQPEDAASQKIVPSFGKKRKASNSDSSDCKKLATVESTVREAATGGAEETTVDKVSRPVDTSNVTTNNEDPDETANVDRPGCVKDNETPAPVPGREQVARAEGVEAVERDEPPTDATICPGDAGMPEELVADDAGMPEELVADDHVDPTADTDRYRERSPSPRVGAAAVPTAEVDEFLKGVVDELVKEVEDMEHQPEEALQPSGGSAVMQQCITDMEGLADMDDWTDSQLGQLEEEFMEEAVSVGAVPKPATHVTCNPVASGAGPPTKQDGPSNLQPIIADLQLLNTMMGKFKTQVSQYGAQLRKLGK